MNATMILIMAIWAAITIMCSGGTYLLVASSFNPMVAMILVASIIVAILFNIAMHKQFKRKYKIIKRE